MSAVETTASENSVLTSQTEDDWPRWFVEQAIRNRAQASSMGTAHNEDTQRIELAFAVDNRRVSCFELTESEAIRLIDMLRYSLQGFGS